jgi:biopolymer transport protein ExbB
MMKYPPNLLKREMLILDELLKGGWMMIPLLVCSVVAIAVIIERYLYFRRIGGKTALADEILVLLEKNQAEQALERARTSSLPLIRVLAAGLADRRSASRAMTAAGIVEFSAMRRGLPVLDTIVTLSPLLGLLGTIIGMIQSFQIMSISGMGQPHAVTGGVAEALIATASGISVAAIALIPYNYFLARVERETARIEHYATRLEAVLDSAGRE